MEFSVVIPSRWNIWKLQWIIDSIVVQTKLPKTTYIVLDKFFSKDEFDVLKYFLTKNIPENFHSHFEFVSNLNYNFLPDSGVSYVRNFWINLVSSEYLYIIDDDNIFENNFFENSLDEYILYLNNLWKSFFAPTVIYRKTWNIQSQWFSWINTFTGKLIPKKIKDKDYQIVKMIWWNSILWKKEYFRDIMFDEYFSFVYEDLDFSWSATNKWYKIIVSNNTTINHMEKTKSRTETSFIWNPEMAYQKSRNRIMLLRKHWGLISNIIFKIFGIWIQTIWFIFLILFFSKNNKYSTIKSVFKWTIDWFKY